jgi:hypothetical protein
MRARVATLAILAFFAQAAAAADIGRIKTLEGAVTVVRGEARLPATAGMPLQQSDRIVTGRDGAAGITFNDNSMLSLGPETTLDISRFSFGASGQPDALDATLHAGTLSAVSGKIVTRSPEAMRIHTPTTILGVRGTEFLVKVTAPAR